MQMLINLLLDDSKCGCILPIARFQIWHQGSYNTTNSVCYSEVIFGMATTAADYYMNSRMRILIMRILF